jgi:hypothetical protein
VRPVRAPAALSLIHVPDQGIEPRVPVGGGFTVRWAAIARIRLGSGGPFMGVRIAHGRSRPYYSWSSCETATSC